MPPLAATNAAVRAATAEDDGKPQSSTGPTDTALVLAARDGERWAREALFRRYGTMINALAFRLLGRDDELDDVVQDTFVSAFSQLHRLVDPQAFSGWMMAILTGIVGKMLRRRSLLARLGLRSKEPPIDWSALISPTAPPDVVAELRVLYGRVGDFPVKVRIPLMLRRVEGLALEEIATATDSSLATVKRRIADGERLLAALLEEGT